MDKEFTHGTMVVFLLESFMRIKWKATVILPMLMDKSTKENIPTIKNMAMVNTLGQMVENTRVIGTTENNMVKESIKIRMEKQEKVYGKMGKK